MLWLLALHICALVCWSALLLYLPAFLAGAHGRGDDFGAPGNSGDSLGRFLYTRVATPAALLTIFAGTLIFLVERNIEPWLIVKLTLVVMLVFCHALIGLLVQRLEQSPDSPLNTWCAVTALSALGLQVAIVWLVLAKPLPEVLSWWR